MRPRWLTRCKSKPEYRIHVLRMEDGDQILIKVDYPLTSQRAEYLQNLIRDRLGVEKTPLVLGPGVEFAILRNRGDVHT